MATYTPTRPIEHLDHDQKPPAPPVGGGGDEGRGDGAPSYGVRLRRARLGLICAIATVSMVFISLTSALIVRRGLPTFDDANRTYFRDWGGVQLPWGLLAINTAILLISSLTMEGARRGILRQHESGQFFCLFVHGGACAAPGRGNCCVAVGGHHFPAA
jgi:hypothetical protein